MSGSIQEAKRKLSLPALMHQLGLGKYAKKSARCPFHDDKHNSFSIWQNGDGWAFKCHAGCGAGDEINFLELHEKLSRRDAVKRFLELADVNGSAPYVPPPNDIKQARSAFDWHACVSAFTDKHLERLAKWRGYSSEFCSWLKQDALIGLHEDCIAFPVHAEAGQVVGAHYRLRGDDNDWRYYPNGVKARPLVIGELIAGDPVHVFESQWDGLAFMDKSGERSGIIVTRGSSNGALVSGLIPQGSTAYAWKQNDETNGKLIKAEKWLKDLVANTRAKVLWVKTPEQHKDLNDWTCAGATSADLLAAIASADVIREAETSSAHSTEAGETKQAQPFPLHCLSPTIEAMARAIAETERTPESLAGCCTLGMLSASIGAGLRVQSSPQRVTRANLNIVSSAESGSGKSETFRHASQPFFDFEAEQVERWRNETLPGLEAERDILESEIATIKKNAGKAKEADERAKIKADLEQKKAQIAVTEALFYPPVLSCEDVTSEKLAVILSKRGEQLASLSPDAGAIVNNLLGRYSKLDRTDESIYLKAYSGDYCRVDRQSRDSIVLRSPCLVALWLTQPDKVETLLAERSLTEGGLIPRLLICHTNAQPRPIVEDAASIPPDVLEAYRQTICTLLETYRLADEPFTIHAAPEAVRAMNTHYNAIVERRLGDLRDVTTFAARWTEQAWRIAVCLHAGLHGACAHEQKLDLATAQCAIELADWFATQQLEILSASREKARQQIWDEVLSLLADKLQGIRASDVYRARIVRNADQAHALLAAMESESELSGRDEQPETGGHVMRIFTRARK